MRTPEEIAKDVEALAAEVLELLRNPVAPKPVVIDESFIGKVCTDDDGDDIKLIYIHENNGGYKTYVFVMIDPDGDMSVLNRSEKDVLKYNW